MAWPTLFVSLAMVITVAGLVSVLRHRLLLGGGLILAGAALGLIAGSNLG